VHQRVTTKRLTSVHRTRPILRDAHTTARDWERAAGDGKAQVVRGPSGETRLKNPDALLLVMFRDGFQLRGGPLRSYQQSSNRSFVKDLLDGYFPFELKREFPEGVPFKLVDHTHVAFDGAVQAGGSGGGSVRSLSSLTAVQVRESLLVICGTSERQSGW
jgi:hypothetical protein